MAITPNEAASKWEAMEAEKINQLERMWDATLSFQFDGENDVRIDDPSPQFSAYAQKKVIALFEAAGWKIDHTKYESTSGGSYYFRRASQ